MTTFPEPFRIGPFVLTEDEVTKRKRFFEFTDEDAQILGETHPLLAAHRPDIIDAFYDYLLSHGHTRELLAAPGRIERLKEIQAQYFLELTSGKYDVAYFENRLRVGLTHERIGLAPEWYLGAYTKYVQLVTDVLGVIFERDRDRLIRTSQALTKVIFLDMSLAIDAYIYSAEEKLAAKAKALEESNHALQKLDTDKRRLTDMIVHDLQNPLAGIVAFLQVLDERPQGLAADERASLQQALARCNDLSQLILNVLQISRAEEGKLDLYFEAVDLVEIGRGTVAAFAVVAEQGRRDLVFSANRNEVITRTDQSLLRRILFNLVRNALRHTPAGTRVEVSVDTGPPVTVTVRDDGPGLPPDVRDRIFEPGALRQLGLQVDSGLGLVFCKMASELLGLRLLLESEPGQGSSFILVQQDGQKPPDRISA